MTTRQVLVLIALSGASVVCADEHVDTADANGDGFVSLYELRAAHYADPEFNKRIEQSFDRYDRNGDGLISADERQARRDAMAVSAGSIAPDEVRATREPDPDPRDFSITESDVRDTAEREQQPRVARSSEPNSRTESWLIQIDADNSGGASIEELVASGGGRQWFAGRDFEMADKSGDGELDAAELATLFSALERRQR